MYSPCIHQGEGTIDITKLSFCKKILDHIYSNEYQENPSLKFLSSLHVLKNKINYNLLSEDEIEIINKCKNLNIKTFSKYYTLELSLDELRELPENINETEKEDFYTCDICGNKMKTGVDEAGIIFSKKSFVYFVSRSGIKEGLGFCYCFIKYNTILIAEYNLSKCFEVTRMMKKGNII